MNDQELDAWLAAARPEPPPASAMSIAKELVDEIGAISQQRPRAERRHRVRTWVGVAAGAALLTAGGTLTAYQLSVPPFQTLEPGLTRVPTAVPVDYIDRGGRGWHCDAFWEFRNAEPAATTQADRFLRDHQWDGFGASAYAEAVQKTAGASVETTTRVFYDVVADRLGTLAQDAFPGVPVRDPGTNGMSYSGSSMACHPVGPR